MADTKTTALPENTSPVATDLLYMVDDPGGSAASQKMTLATLNTFIKATGGRVLISEQTPTGTGTLSWASIPATYRSLEIEFIARGTAVATSVNMNVYFNNDTTAGNYRRTLILGGGTTAISTSGADDAVGSIIAGASSPANSCGQGILKIVNYASTTFNKQCQIQTGSRVDAATTHEYAIIAMMEWESAVAINRVDLTLASGNYATGSTFRLYGVY